MTSGEITVTGKQAAELTITPLEVVENATTQAKLLMDIVNKTKAFQEIAGKKYLQVEAWETILAFNQAHAETEWVRPIKTEPLGETIGYEAKVNIVRRGEIIGSGIMPCYFTENCCKGKEGDAKHKAAMSAAQTFAESKASRMNYSFVALLAGYQPTPAEEITGPEGQNKSEEKEHWCTEHNTAFFKTPKMKSYAHPIEGTIPTQWCHEPAESPKPTPAVTGDTRTPSEAQTQGNVPAEVATLGEKVKEKVKAKRDLATITTIEKLAAALKADFGLNYAEQYKELNINAWHELTISPAKAYEQVAASRQ